MSLKGKRHTLLANATGLTHKDALHLYPEKAVRRIDPVNARGSGGKIIQVGSQGHDTFASTVSFYLAIHSTDRLALVYELCSARFLIALSMPEKIIA